MKKSLFLLLALMLALALCFTACGGDSGETPEVEQQPVHTHKYGEWVTIKKATCAENGEMARYCDCGEKQTETLYATGEHTEAIDKAVAPTCTEAGLTEGKHCSVCNAVLVAQTAVDPTGHNEVTDAAVAPTCTKEGLTEGKHCSVCNEVIVKQGVAPIVAHTYDDKYDESCNVCGGTRDAECAHTTTEPILGYAATCTEPGLTEGTKCKKCGEILTHQTTINAKGHTEVTDEAVAATCTASGLTTGKHCSVCDAVLVKQSVVPTLPHTYGEWTVTKNANCGQDGEMARYCTCGAKQTEVIYGAGMHTEVTDFAVAPTCTSTGLTEGKHCSYCNTILVQQTVVPMLEHTYNTTFSFDGSFHWYACRDCGTAKDKAEHTLDEGEICTICNEPIGPTVGIIYDKSADGTYAMVVAYNGSAKKIRIADTYEGLPVKTIYDSAFYNNDSITSVIIPDSVTTIGNSAFSDCSNLTSVVIPDSVTTIGSQAFIYCGDLTSVVIPNSVTTIGNNAFWSTEIKFNEYENGKYLGTDDNPYFALVQLTSKNLSSYTIHEDTKIIADNVFYGCERLTSITIPNSVTTIGEDAFAHSNSLTYVVIGDSVTTIGDDAFYACDSLTSVVIPDSVTTIGEEAFAHSDSLTSVVIGDSVTTIGKHAFYKCSSLTSVVIPDSVTTIGEDAFAHSDSLTSVVIGDRVTTIGDDAFYGCDSLTSVVIGDSVTTIGNSAFSSCSKLKDVYYTGSEEEWKAITIGSDNSRLTNATKHYNYVPEE